MAALLKKRALAEFCQTHLEELPRPPKRLQLVRKSRAIPDANDLTVALLDGNCDSLIPSLISLTHTLPLLTEAQESTVVSQLIDLLQDETQSEIVIIKVLSVLASVHLANSSQLVMDAVLSLARRKKVSQRVVSECINTAFHASVNSQSQLQQPVIQLALLHLTTTTSFVGKSCCLKALGGLCPTSEMGNTCQALIFSALTEHINHQDSRVRTAAGMALVMACDRGIVLPANVYGYVCVALNDDYQRVRGSSLSLIKAIALQDAEREVPIVDSIHSVRLVDHAFAQICSAVNDVSIRVRTQAASLLGTLTCVSEKFLLQTLDKKLMSNMKRKRSAHERSRALVETGEFSSGKRWGDDTPKEEVEAESVTLMTIGACGAFVHGLEDEFMEVRSASLDSMCSLALSNAQFADLSLDFLVDMFNDEIEQIRLKAIQVLKKVACNIMLRSDQLAEILHALKDSSLDIRESLHVFLSNSRLSTVTCVQMVISGLLDNLRRYPQDKRSIHRCLSTVGGKHAVLVLGLVPELLVLHPYMDAVEPTVQDQEYICKLILVVNAAATCPTILPLLEPHFLRHYSYVRNTMPHLVPNLKLGNEKVIVKSTSFSSISNTVHFLQECLRKIESLEKSSTQLRQTMYQTVYSDLVRIADIDPSISAAVHFAALQIQCLLLFSQIVTTHNWLSPSCLNVQTSSALRSRMETLLRNTFRLRHAFTRLTPYEEASVRNLRARTLALQLVYVVHGSTGSALGLCDSFLEHIESLHRYLIAQGIPADPFLTAVVDALSQLEEPRPGAVARILQPLLTLHSLPAVPMIAEPAVLRICSAEILEPTAHSEVVHKMGAGMVAGVLLDAELSHIPDPVAVRIRIVYPDHSVQLVIPPSSDLRGADIEGCHRLLTTVLVSAAVWSESCQVAMSLVLDLSEHECTSKRKGEDNSCIIQLCKPVLINVWPKPIRRGI